jgi:hypothetical protein
MNLQRLAFLLCLWAFALPGLAQEPGLQFGFGTPQVKNIACVLQGDRIKVLATDDSDRRAESSRHSCSESLDELVRAGYRFVGTSGDARTGIVHTLVAPTPLADDEIGLTTNGAAGCNCDDALPITGFTCQSCSVSEQGGCFCLFKSKSPSG